MIEKIEDARAHSGVQALLAEMQYKWARDLEVKRGKARKTSDVPWSNIFTELVLHRIRESGVQVVDRDKCQVPRRRERAPEQNTVRRIKGEPPARIELDDRLGEIPKELIEIVEVAKGA